MLFKLPRVKADDWRHTDLTLITNHEFKLLSTTSGLSDEIKEQIRTKLLANTTSIVIINGRYIAELSNLSLDAANIEVLELEKLGNNDANNEYSGLNAVFAEFNAKNSTQSVHVMIKNNLHAQLQLLNISIPDSDAHNITNPEINIQLADNINADILEDICSLGNGINLHNGVTQITLGCNSKVNHSLMQNIAVESFMVEQRSVTINAKSEYIINLVSKGSRLSRINLKIDLNAPNASVNINGLTLIESRQIIDVNTIVKHNAESCVSSQVHKSVVNGFSHSIFNGTVYVSSDAPKTEAHQQNRNLILSAKAKVTTEPKLEINNEDVICTHGATISELDHDTLFFLQSRGIDKVMAKQLCMQAFIHEVLQKIPNPEFLAQYKLMDM